MNPRQYIDGLALLTLGVVFLLYSAYLYESRLSAPFFPGKSFVELHASFYIAMFGVIFVIISIFIVLTKRKIITQSPKMEGSNVMQR